MNKKFLVLAATLALGACGMNTGHTQGMNNDPAQHPYAQNHGNSSWNHKSPYAATAWNDTGNFLGSPYDKNGQFAPAVSHAHDYNANYYGTYAAPQWSGWRTYRFW